MNKPYEDKSTLCTLNALRIDMIRTNIIKWDSLWESAESRYKNMTQDEMGRFYASLKTIAFDTMNELSALRKNINPNTSSRIMKDETSNPSKQIHR